jgi:hypothetical protein
LTQSENGFNFGSNRNEVAWDGRNDRGMLLGSGLYLYRLTVGDQIEIRRMVLLK